MSERTEDTLQTRCSIFLKLRSNDPAPRELAWAGFRERYAPVIAGFAKRLGAKPHDIDDIIQDVLLGFFAVSPRFVYEPSRGRFRGYLKTATLNTIRARFGKEIRIATIPISEIGDDAEPIESNWAQSWREQQLRRALELVRAESAAHPKTFEAFELYVLRDIPADEVARRLSISVDSIYQAKHRISEALRAKIAELESEVD